MEITRGVTARAQRVVIYGPEGIGKTSLAARFPGAVFIDTEGSTRNFDVARYPIPNAWQNLIQTVQYAMQHPEQQQTLVIDTADWAEHLCVQAVCDRAQKTGIEDFGYGKGYVYLKEEFGKLLTFLDGVIDAGVHVVVTAHAAMRKVEQPDEMGSYDRWELKLSKHVAPLVKEWADLILFCNYKTFLVYADKEGKKGKAQGGQRVMYTSHHPCWDAKNRHGLPPELPMDYQAIAHIFGGPPAPQPVQQPLQTVQPPQQPLQPAPPPVAPQPPTPPPQPPAPPAAPEDADAALAARYPALAGLMHTAQVTADDVQLAVNSAGYFPPDMPILDYPEDFVHGVLEACWPQVLATIVQEQQELPF